MGDHTTQAVSWANPYGSKQHKSLVGQIYFPYDNAELDPGDEAMLDRLIGFYIIALLGRRVRLRFEAHCDFRGSTQYNRRLAERRAKAVQAYVDGKLGRSFRFLSSSMVAWGEKYAGRTGLMQDRRVDIFSSFVPKRPPIELPPTVIKGKVAKKMVRRPIEFLDIEHFRLSFSGPHDHNTPTWHHIVLEKHQMIDAEHTFPYDARIVETTQHDTFPVIQVHRYRIKWRKPKASDTVKKVSAVLLNVLAGAAGKAGGYDFGEGIPKLKPPNVVYNSWDAFLADHPENREYAKYRNRPL